MLDILLPSAGISDKYIESLLNLNHTRKKDSSLEPATETVLKRFPAIADHVCYPALDCFIGTLFSSILYSFQFCKKQTFRLLPLFNQTLRGGYSSLFANGGKEYFFILGETEDKYQKCFGDEFLLKTYSYFGLILSFTATISEK